MVARNLVAALAQLELAESCVIEGVMGQAIGAGDSTNLLESAPGALVLRDCDRAIQCHAGAERRGAVAAEQF